MNNDNGLLKAISELGRIVADLRYTITWKNEEIAKLEIELAEYKKAEMEAVGFGKDEQLNEQKSN